MPKEIKATEHILEKGQAFSVTIRGIEIRCRYVAEHISPFGKVKARVRLEAPEGVKGVVLPDIENSSTRYCAKKKRPPK